MNLREYVVTVILILAILIGGYKWLSSQLLATTATIETSISELRY